MTTGSTTIAAIRRARARYGLAALVVLPAVFAVIWVVFIASDTPAGPLVTDPDDFVTTLLNGLTISGLYFIVASGFTLIFGLMRAVNMAHGSVFLLGGYLAIELQRNLVGRGAGISPSEVSILEWILPLLLASVVAGLVGLVMHQLFIRPFQGEDLRQALITIAISVILADQMIARFGGVAKDLAWPAALFKFVDYFGIRYSVTRLFILGSALVVGVLLWLWLKKTRTGMVIRAGVDDTPMVQALGINVQVVFALAFVVGSVLAGVGGVMGASFAALAPGVDGLWLLNSLVVVIIGGMGSLSGAAAGSLLYGIVTAFAPAYLPAAYTHYSIIFTFVLLVGVLAVRPYGLFGKPA